MSSIFLSKNTMPIETNIPLHPVSQSEFGQVAYEVVGHAFAVHKRLGRIFDESVYRKTLAHILSPHAAHEVCIRLTHADFEKRSFMDLVVDGGSPFELKVASAIHERHRQQLIQYLMLTDLHHGKVINFGADRVEHEFVNCHETAEHRRSFQVDLSRWSSQATGARRFQEIVVDMLRDWGTGLDRGLYIDAVTHFLGGPDVVRQPVETLWDGIVVGRQNVNLVAPNIGFEITCLRADGESYEENLRRFLANTTLEKIFWVNGVSGNVGFVLLSK